MKRFFLATATLLLLLSVDLTPQQTAHRERNFFAGTVKIRDADVAPNRAAIRLEDGRNNAARAGLQPPGRLLRSFDIAATPERLLYQAEEPGILRTEFPTMLYSTNPISTIMVWLAIRNTGIRFILPPTSHSSIRTRARWGSCWAAGRNQTS